ncbi:ATP-binding protein [uncultured Winogradskyella sp.]|uniref:ATP-binding protein n=1 Tax=uncultured Winogradskyella sp. TaxID=395353 RepID=UPI002638F7C7|nr:ATP-binding protein [uncultured Winogradskyella sp.]
MNIERIVITGGPATGKTAIIDDLASRGHYCFEEVIRKLTAKAKDTGDITDLHSNPIALVSDSNAFNTNLINLRIDDFNDATIAKEKQVFYDRGIPDVLAYMSYFDQPISEAFNTICKTYKYDKIFLLPPWEAIYTDDGERFETFEQAVDIYHKLKETYQEFDYSIIEVPFGTIEERTDFIISHTHL